MGGDSNLQHLLQPTLELNEVTRCLQVPQAHILPFSSLPFPFLHFSVRLFLSVSWSLAAALFLSPPHLLFFGCVSLAGFCLYEVIRVFYSFTWVLVGWWMGGLFFCIEESRSDEQIHHLLNDLNIICCWRRIFRCLLLMKEGMIMMHDAIRFSFFWRWKFCTIVWLCCHHHDVLGVCWLVVYNVRLWNLRMCRLCKDCSVDTKDSSVYFPKSQVMLMVCIRIVGPTKLWELL